MDVFKIVIGIIQVFLGLFSLAVLMRGSVWGLGMEQYAFNAINNQIKPAFYFLIAAVILQGMLNIFGRSKA